MADKLSIRDLKGIFRGREVSMLVGEGGPEDGVDQYSKYGIYCLSKDDMEFLCVIMERDDPAANPDGPWTEDDYIPHSVARFDIDSQTWKTEAGNMNLISSASFSFLDTEDEFIDELQKFMEKRKPTIIASASNVERFDESEP
jgi:hypothetical protein